MRMTPLFFLFILGFSFYFFSYVSATTVISPTKQWVVESITGNESKLFDVNIQGDRLCLLPKFEDRLQEMEIALNQEPLPKDVGLIETTGELKEGNISYKLVEYIQPTTVKVKSYEGDVISIAEKDSKTKQICYILNPEIGWYKFGEESIIVTNVNRRFPSIDYNLSNQNASVRLNVTNQGIYNNLILYTPFDNSQSTTATYDLSPYGYDGTLAGNTYYEDNGLFGKSVFMDGATDWITVSTMPKLSVNNSNLTLSLWIKPASIASPASQYFLSKVTSTSATGGYGFRMGMQQDTATVSKIQLAYYNESKVQMSAYTTSGVIVKDVWQHIVYVLRSDGTSSLYYNNQEIINTTNNGGLLASAVKVTKIGGLSYTTSLTVNGSIDDLMLFDTALTPNQISEIFNNQSSRFLPKGEQQIYTTTIEQNGSYNKLNVTTSSQQEMSSSIKLRIQEWNGTYNDSVDGTVPEDLKLWLHMDNRTGYESDGVAYDYSGNGNNGTSIGANYTNSGFYKGGFYFDGSDYMSLGNSSSMSIKENLTVGLWIKGASQNSYVFANYDVTTNKRSWGLRPTGTTMHAIISDNGLGTVNDIKRYATNRTVMDNTWHHFMFTFSNNSLRLYVDGIEDTVIGKISDPVLSYVYPNNRNVTVGCFLDDTTPSSYFTGYVDELMIFNETLTAQQVWEIYNASYLKFDGADEWQTVQAGSGINIFNISSATQGIRLLYNYSTDQYNFYTPIIQENISLDSYYQSDGEGGEPPVTDDEYPIFNYFVELPVNPATYTTTAIYSFNTTIINTNGTAGIEFGGINYSLTNNTNNFTKIFPNLGAGVYSYYYWAYGNGTNKNYNKTEERDYTIFKAENTPSLRLNELIEDESLTYPQTVNASAYCTNGDVTLYRDEIQIFTNDEAEVLGAGNYIYTALCPANQNYSIKDANLTAEINKSYSVVTTTIDGAQSDKTIYNGSSATVEGTLSLGEGSIYLYINDTLIDSGSSPLTNISVYRNLGTYVISTLYLESQNFTGSNENWTITVQVDTPAPVSNVTTVVSSRGRLSIGVNKLRTNILSLIRK